MVNLRREKKAKFMSNELQIFKNEEFGQVRITIIDKNPTFNLYDLSYDLGYIKEAKGNIYLRKDLIENICQTLDITGLSLTDNKIIITKDSNFEEIYITEESFYDLCLESHAKNARSFRKWVTSEVLPSIRKHGMYAMDDLLENPDLAIKALTALKEERQKRLELESKVNEQNKVIEEQSPMVAMAERFSTADSLMGIRKVAKILNERVDKNKAIGEKQLFEILRKEKILQSSDGEWNIPYQSKIDAGYFILKPSTYNNGYGKTKTELTPKVTGKGLEWIWKQLLLKGYIQNEHIKAV
jgi:anti-repressor protein